MVGGEGRAKPPPIGEGGCRTFEVYDDGAPVPPGAGAAEPDETEVLLECACALPARARPTFDSGELAMGTCLIDREGDDDDPAVDDDRTVFDLKGCTVLRLGLRMAIGFVDEGEDDNEVMDGLGWCMGVFSRKEDEVEEPMLSFLIRDMANPEDGDWAVVAVVAPYPTKSPLAICLAGWICAPGLLAVLAGRINLSATAIGSPAAPPVDTAREMMFLGGERVVRLVIDESRW